MGKIVSHVLLEPTNQSRDSGSVMPVHLERINLVWEVLAAWTVHGVPHLEKKQPSVKVSDMWQMAKLCQLMPN